MRNVFLFSGQGSQYHQMGKRLFEVSPLFRDNLLHLDRLSTEITGLHVVDELHSHSKATPFSSTRYTHPAIFMVEYALAKMLIQLGIKPDIVLGASLGTFGAAAISGWIDVEQALQAVSAQAEALQSNCHPGGMIAILEELSAFDELCRHEQCELSGISFDSHFTVSAPLVALDRLETVLSAEKLSYQRLAVEYAYHSCWIDEARIPFLAAARSLKIRQHGLPLMCCDQGEQVSSLTADSFWHAIRRPIRFRDTVRCLQSRGKFRYIDVGPSGTLATFLKYLLNPQSGSVVHTLMSPFAKEDANLEALLKQAV